MSKNPYTHFEKDQLILRDELAIDRTRLANERTLLSYLRGAIAAIIAGITFIHYVDHGILFYVGRALLPFGILVAIFGYFRYRRIDGRLRPFRTTTRDPKP